MKDRKPRVPAIGRLIAPEREAFFRELYRHAFRAALPTVKDVKDPEAFFADPDSRLRFFTAAHRGFASAQESILARILELEAATNPAAINELLALRKISDGIAWQMIRGEVYLARRLFRGVKPPRLSQSNFESVHAVARNLVKEDFSAFALMSDLTSFVQVGDLVVFDANTGQLTFTEVKEGEKNKKIMDFVNFISDAQCGRAIQYFREQEGEKTFEQLLRTVRQIRRITHVADVANYGKGRDPDHGYEIQISEEPLRLEGYDPRLAKVIDASNSNGWAIDVIDGCLFVAAYRGLMLPGSGLMFAIWLEGLTGKEPEGKYPASNLLECMSLPLGLPLYCRGLSEDQIFDLLCGRCVVMVGLNLDEFIARASKYGLTAKWSTRSEAQQFPKWVQPFKIDHRALKFSYQGRDALLSDGLLVKMFFHGIRPDTALAIILSYLSRQPG